MFKYLFPFLIFLVSCSDLNSVPTYHTDVYVVGKKINGIEYDNKYIDTKLDSNVFNLKFGTTLKVYSDSILSIRVYSKSPKFKNYHNTSNSNLIYITTIN